MNILFLRLLSILSMLFLTLSIYSCGPGGNEEDSKEKQTDSSTNSTDYIESNTLTLTVELGLVRNANVNITTFDGVVLLSYETGENGSFSIDIDSLMEEVDKLSPTPEFLKVISTGGTDIDSNDDGISNEEYKEVKGSVIGIISVEALFLKDNAVRINLITTAVADILENYKAENINDSILTNVLENLGMSDVDGNGKISNNDAITYKMTENDAQIESNLREVYLPSIHAGDSNVRQAFIQELKNSESLSVYTDTFTGNQCAVKINPLNKDNKIYYGINIITENYLTFPSVLNGNEIHLSNLETLHYEECSFNNDVRKCNQRKKLTCCEDSVQRTCSIPKIGSIYSDSVTIDSLREEYLKIRHDFNPQKRSELEEQIKNKNLEKNDLETQLAVIDHQIDELKNKPEEQITSSDHQVNVDVNLVLYTPTPSELANAIYQDSFFGRSVKDIPGWNEFPYYLKKEAFFQIINKSLEENKDNLRKQFIVSTTENLTENIVSYFVDNFDEIGGTIPEIYRNMAEWENEFGDSAEVEYLFSFKINIQQKSNFLALLETLFTADSSGRVLGEAYVEVFENSPFIPERLKGKVDLETVYFLNAYYAAKNGEQTYGSLGFQWFATITSLIAEPILIATEPFINAVNDITSGAGYVIEEGFKNDVLFNIVYNSISDTVKDEAKRISNEIVESIKKSGDEFGEYIDSLAIEHPEAARNIRATIKLGEAVSEIIPATKIKLKSFDLVGEIKKRGSGIPKIESNYITSSTMRNNAFVFEPDTPDLKNRVNDIIVNGDSKGKKTETIMSEIFEAKGFDTKFDGIYNDKDNGFDGVYVKGSIDNPTEVIIMESKQMDGFGIQLNKGDIETGLAPQMSSQWIDDTIKNLRGPPKYNTELANLLLKSRKNNLIKKYVSAVDKSTAEIKILQLEEF